MEKWTYERTTWQTKALKIKLLDDKVAKCSFYKQNLHIKRSILTKNKHPVSKTGCYFYFVSLLFFTVRLRYLSGVSGIEISQSIPIPFSPSCLPVTISYPVKA